MVATTLPQKKPGLGMLAANSTEMNKLKDLGVQDVKHSIRSTFGQGFIVRNSMTTANSPALIATILSDSVIQSRDRSGVVRRFGRVEPLTDHKRSVPILDRGTPTVHHVDEGGVVAASDVTFGKVNLTGRLASVRMVMSTEVVEDAPSFMSRIVSQAGLALARDEDRACFVGDGTLASNGVVGIAHALLASAIVTGPATVNALTLEQFSDAMEMLPEFDAEPPRWFMSRSVFAKSAGLLQSGAGVLLPPGSDADAYFLGHPVTFVPSMARSNAGSGETVALFGHLDLAGVLGANEGVKIRESAESADDTFQVMVTSRYSFVCHDVGTATPTDPSGSMVGIQLS